MVETWPDSGWMAREPSDSRRHLTGSIFRDDAFTPDEVKGLYDVGNDATLAYSAASFDALKQVHDAESGSTTIGNLQWTYAANLSGSAGLSGSNPNYTLVLNDSPAAGSRTGLTSASGVVGTVVVLQ